MRYGQLPLLLAASLLRVSCASAQAPAPVSPSPAPRTDAPPARPAEAAVKLSGFWLVTVQRGGQSLDHSMHLALTAGELVGSITGPDGNSHELSKITLKGDKVSWEIGGERTSQRFEGTIKGSSMEGKIKMARSSRGEGRERGKGGGQSGDDGGGDTSASPPGEGQPPSGGGGRGGRGGGGKGGRGGAGRGGFAAEVTWKAFKSVEPPPEVTPPPAKPAGAGATLSNYFFEQPVGELGQIAQLRS